MLDLRMRRSQQPLTSSWQTMRVASRGSTQLGLSLRTPQVHAFGLDMARTLDALLHYPFELIRLGAYWNRIEPAPGAFEWDELDRQIDAAEHAGKRIVLCAGALKTFGYPEFFVPAHRLPRPLPEGRRITPADFPDLLAAACEFLTRVVERYRDRAAIAAWHVEHESVDPLGFEHSWRLDRAFVRAEVNALRRAAPDRPVLLNGFLPAALPVRLTQWWQTRDQGDSIAAAQDLADIVGLDYYPRHALARVGRWTLYVDGAARGGQRRCRDVLDWAGRCGRRVMVTEGQAEPWEAVTQPPNPRAMAMHSCPPEQLIVNHNRCQRWARAAGGVLEAYLFWGAEYWLARKHAGDASYLGAFARVLDSA